jgi:DNA-binding response OmpR family regulator
LCKATTDPLVAADGWCVTRVLVCEDDDDIRRLVALLARDVADAVVDVADVASALAALDAGVFELVVTDLGLPDGSGVAVCAAAAGSGSRVVVMTADHELGETAAVQAAAETVLHKPFTAANLLSAIQGVAPA